MWRCDAPGRRARAAAALAGLALAAGCAAPTLPEPSPGEPAGERWLGRFSANWTIDTVPPRSDSASGRFTLTAAAARSQIEIFSPFGQTVARAVTDAQSSVLETGDGRRFEAANPEALTEAVLGWRVPVQHLAAWLSDDRPDRAVDDGWEVTVDARAQGRPTRMTMRWPAEGADGSPRRVTIRLVVDEAQTLPAAARHAPGAPEDRAAPAPDAR